VLIKESDYKAHKDNLSSVTPFAKIYAFYNHTATNNNSFQISSKVGGNARFLVSNPTNKKVEFRQGGITGDILGYVAPNMTDGNVIYLETGIYDIYPIFKFYLPGENEVYSVIPRYTDGDLIGLPYMQTFTFTDNYLERSFNVNTVYNAGDFNWSSGGVYFRVINKSGVDVRIAHGDIPQITSLGVPAVLPGRTETFTIHITKNPADGSYPAKESISQIRIGSNQGMLTVPEREYQLDWLYSIEVTGTNNSNLVLGTVQELQKIDLDALLGN
jgi:hypothetical protein